MGIWSAAEIEHALRTALPPRERLFARPLHRYGYWRGSWATAQTWMVIRHRIYVRPTPQGVVSGGSGFVGFRTLDKRRAGR